MKKLTKKEVIEVKKRLEYLRQELRAERISYGELAELQAFKKYIDPSDVELLEAAGVPKSSGGSMGKGGEAHLEKVAKWMEQHEANLKSLYRSFKNETGDKDTPFAGFCLFMFDQCKH